MNPGDGQIFRHKCHTIALTLALAVATIALVVLAVALLSTAVLRVVALLVVLLLLLVLRCVSSVCLLTGLERSGAWRESGGTRLERVDAWLEAALRGGGVHVKLLLSLLGEVLILSRRIILPRVRGRHYDVFNGGRMGYVAL
jgi:hypothetical protein